MPNETEQPEPGRHAELDREHRLQLEYENRWHRGYQQAILSAIVSLALSFIVAAALWAWVRFSEIDVQRARVTILRERANAPAPSTGGTPAAVGKNPADTRGLSILLDTLRQAPGGEQKAGTPSGKTALGPLLSLVDSLVGLGKLTAETASDLKQELTKAAIEGGKDILVDAAKTVIRKYLAPETAATAGTPAVQVNVTGACCCPQQATTQPHTHTPITPKKVLCPGSMDTAPAKPAIP